MFAKAIYLGIHLLGSDLEINGIKVMQTDWQQLCKPIILAFGKCYEGVNPAFCEIFAVEMNGKRAFFLANENGIGEYHVFKFSDKATEKLCSNKKLKTKL